LIFLLPETGEKLLEGTVSTAYSLLINTCTGCHDSCNRTFFNDTTTTSGPGLIIGEASRLHSPLSLGGTPLDEWTNRRRDPHNTHAHGGIRTRNSNKRAAAEPRLRAHGQWDRPLFAR